MTRRPFLFVLVLIGLSVDTVPKHSLRAAEPPTTYSVGAAQVEITPSYPVRLSGFGFRRIESEGVTQAIWVRALAISPADGSDPAILITTDNLGIPAYMHDELARRLAAKAGVKRERLTITATHTHTAPMLRSVAPTLFGQPIPPEHQQHIDQYTRELTDRLEEVSLAALKDRRPSRLTWGVGTVSFAINRRTKGGPVDHDLPLLAVRDLDGKLRAIHFTYACHCVTLSNNKISGDWAGYAVDLVQRDFPEVIALCSVGCGADSNPSSGVTGDKVDVAMKQGAEVAAEVKRLVNGFLTPVTGTLMARRETITLEFAAHPSREQWEERAKKTDAVGYHARVQLERLDRGEKLQEQIDYPVASWTFGDSLAMVFLPGEVVVDYSLRLKRELDRSRLWVCAYANDAPCYIPSERVLKEGGYEATGAMIYYDRPGPFKEGLEQPIIETVRKQLEPAFSAKFNGAKTQGALPRSPQQSLATLETTPNLRVELVVAEPLITDPVAIDFRSDGGLWVAEMHDYPTGLDGNFQPGGRVRLVRDTNGDGTFDASTIFVEGIPFPTGVTSWKSGVLICAAPDILFAEDTDGDDRADVVRKLYSGFGTGNYQARVNSLIPGSDGWVYGSCGLFGGKITNSRGETLELGDRDFRIKPETGEIEPATGRTQQGRVRDDWGHWFGCDNSNLAWHYPLEEHYLRRNPYIVPPPARVNIVQTTLAPPLLPLLGNAQRFKLSGPPGNVTAACGLGVYRDDRLGEDYTGDLFTCEPVNLLVHRLKPTAKETSFVASRTPAEKDREFLRSSDGWFRPVQAITGPDGGLWIVDFYRFVIEHPRWIPEDDLAQVDVRAGQSLGRIYRVVRADQPAPPASQPRKDPDPAALRMQLTDSSPRRRRLALEALRQSITPADIDAALRDDHPQVRRYAVYLAEQHAARQSLLPAVLVLAADADPQVRLQVACSLGAWDDPRVGSALAQMARTTTDPWLHAAILSSIRPENIDAVVTGTFSETGGPAAGRTFIEGLIATAVGIKADPALAGIVRAMLQTPPAGSADWQSAALTTLLDSLARKGRGLDAISDESLRSGIQQRLEAARTDVANTTLPSPRRIAAIELLGREQACVDADLDLMGGLLVPQSPPDVQAAIVRRLARISLPRVPELLTVNWARLSPSVRSAILDALLGREAWVSTLLERLESGGIAVSDIDASRRQRLLSHTSSAVKDRAARLLQVPVNADRQAILAQYASALSLAGDRERGKALFTKTCAVCHKLGEEGHAVGPDLAMLASKSPQFFLQELLDPNRNVDSRYTTYVAALGDGRTLSGLLASETGASITLLAAEGKRTTILRADLDELQGTGKSLMPEGLEKDVSPQAMADLIAFLITSGPPRKILAGNTPAVVKPDRGRFRMPASVAEIFGSDITFETQFQNIGYWHGVNDHVVWSVENAVAAEFDVWLDYACERGSAGNGYAIEGAFPSLNGVIDGTGDWSTYRLARLGTISLPAGNQRITMRPAGPALKGALADVRGLHLVPRGEPVALAEPNAPAAAPKPPAVEQTPADIARQLLDDRLPADKRQALIAASPARAADLIVEMTRDLAKETNGSAEEYRRIPWIWRVAVAIGKRNREDELLNVIEVSLPVAGQPLRDWQSVVIGGGIINGISLANVWPAPRIATLLKGRPELHQRWQAALTAAAVMADNPNTRNGTRYDALRMIALDDWTRCRPQLERYLAKGTEAELQMGAVSGLSDVESADVSRLLIPALGDLPERNRTLAIEALLRNDERRSALLTSIEAKQADAGHLSKMHRQALLETGSEANRAHARRLFTP